MASQAKSKSEAALRFLRNPLKLLKQKEPIVPAMGHVFNSDLACGHCGKPWQEQRDQPTSCAPIAELAQTPKGDPAGDV
jgi:hypothetical protein